MSDTDHAAQAQAQGYWPALWSPVPAETLPDPGFAERVDEAIAKAATPVPVDLVPSAEKPPC